MRYKYRRHATRTRLRRIGTSMDSVQAPPPTAAFAARPCVCTVRGNGLLWRSRGSHCAATTTLRCSHCVHLRTPTHGAYFEHAQSARRGMETQESSRRPTEMPRSCFCALGDLTARTMAFCIFSGRRADSVRTQLWCDRPLTMHLDPFHITCFFAYTKALMALHLSSWNHCLLFLSC